MAEEDAQNENATDSGNEAAANPADFQQVEDQAAQPDLSLDLLLDISLPVSVELGRVSMTVEELLQVGTGSVIELDKMAGEPADLYVRNARFARGEVVVVDDNFGLRITEIIDRNRRVEHFSE